MAAPTGRELTARSLVLAALLLGTLTVVVVWGAHQAWFEGTQTRGPVAAGQGKPAPPAYSSGGTTPVATPPPGAQTSSAASGSAPAVAPSAGGESLASAPPATETEFPLATVPPTVIVNEPVARAVVHYLIDARGEVTTPLAEFEAEVAQILADPLGWESMGLVFAEVTDPAQADITIWLTEPAKVPSFSGICSSNLSCSIGSNIIVNEQRWLEGALPGAMDEVPLDQYRIMVVNHEVGHWLGHHQHSACPGAGQLAPLMMQQSKGLDGCLFNPYPLPEELTAPDLGLY
ncbi:MAG: DUF3152 domain-containing protein [Bifidobacteriaceae bacterium]|jgi:hypothetical protein|nr:DUF3152 domain-containing protein [Bifidobacteriaceae bacterium]